MKIELDIEPWGEKTWGRSIIAIIKSDADGFEWRGRGNTVDQAIDEAVSLWRSDNE
jgi:hypothetical protein